LPTIVPGNRSDIKRLSAERLLPATGDAAAWLGEQQGAQGRRQALYVVRRDNVEVIGLIVVRRNSASSRMTKAARSSLRSATGGVRRSRRGCGSNPGGALNAGAGAGYA